MKSLVECSCDCGPECGCDDPRSKHCCSPYTPASMKSTTRGGECRVEDWPRYDGNKRYDQFFKTQCPQAYSWQFDDLNSTFQCKETDYEVTFCPTGQTPAPITRPSTTTTKKATKTTKKFTNKAVTKAPTKTTSRAAAASPTHKKKKKIIIVKVVVVKKKTT
ncbi:hypothetical protein HK097_009742 [Rhizophlyctis rosea]|uniref:Uncharacterized protein n=1 Tax=Rhizophlyctis rosea TaxID=64517 RepID=A0AAD5X080_9FUNG|nr:hypothetical protein HK097_009742 [Rhizophlyctis rosea]